MLFIIFFLPFFNTFCSPCIQYHKLAIKTNFQNFGFRAFEQPADNIMLTVFLFSFDLLTVWGVLISRKRCRDK